MRIDKINEVRLSRRQVVAAGGSALAVLALFGPAAAAPADADARLAEITGGKPLQKGRMAIEMPSLTDEGRFVPLRVAVDSPMTEADHVRALHVLAERNTVPEVASYAFSPLAGKAEIITRIRLARTQVVVAVAEMSDGSMHVAKAMCKVVGEGGGCG